MSIDKKSAEEIVAYLSKANSLCNESLRIIKTNEVLGHIHVYGRLVGEFLGHSYLNILAPIWKAYPDLMPPEMKESHVETEPTLCSESQAALSQFVSEAQKAIEEIKRLVPIEKSANTFNFDGLEEVEKALVDIEDFMAKPRFRD
jgi:hypothetical protein